MEVVAERVRTSTAPQHVRAPSPEQQVALTTPEDPVASVATTADTQQVVSPLASGVTYSFRVRAINEGGSDWSPWTDYANLYIPQRHLPGC